MGLTYPYIKNGKWDLLPSQTHKVIILFLMFILKRERERQRQSMSGEGEERERERETQNLKMAPGSKLSAQSLMRGLNS